VRADRGLIDSTVEETLRYRPPLRGRIALDCLIDRILQPRLCQDSLEYEPNLITPTPRRLELEWDAT
jgi:cytochrome P450